MGDRPRDGHHLHRHRAGEPLYGGPLRRAREARPGHSHYGLHRGVRHRRRPRRLEAANPIGGADSADFTDGEFYNILKASVNFPPPAIHGAWRNVLTKDSTPGFNWTLVRGARAYEIIIASDSGFSRVVTSQVTNSLSVNLNSPLDDGKYYWRVRAYNGNLEPGRFSQTQSFTIDTTAPPAPLLMSPAENAKVSTRPFFQWERLDTATKYHIEVDNNPDFSSPEYTSSKQEASVRMPRLARGTYFWRVRANDQAGNLGIWSVSFTFIIP